MPCQGGPRIPGLRYTTEFGGALCVAMKAIERHGITLTEADFADSPVNLADLIDWWSYHQAEDRSRLKKEAEARHQADVVSAFEKTLSPEDLKAFRKSLGKI